MAKPTVHEFQDDTKLMEKVRELSSQGVSKGDLYVISHDDDRTDRVASKVDANEPEELETLANRYDKKGDELRAIFQDFGFSEDEAGELEEKLDHGKMLLMDASGE